MRERVHAGGGGRGCPQGRGYMQEGEGKGGRGCPTAGEGGRVRVRVRKHKHEHGRGRERERECRWQRGSAGDGGCSQRRAS
jgi:hypothetical protein